MVRNSKHMQAPLSKEQTARVFCYAPEAVTLTPFPIRTFHLYVKRGLIPSYRIGRHRLFKKDEVVAAIERFRVSTTAEILS